MTCFASLTARCLRPHQDPTLAFGLRVDAEYAKLTLSNNGLARGTYERRWFRPAARATAGKAGGHPHAIGEIHVLEHPRPASLPPDQPRRLRSGPDAAVP